MTLMLAVLILASLNLAASILGMYNVTMTTTVLMILVSPLVDVYTLMLTAMILMNALSIHVTLTMAVKLPILPVTITILVLLIPAVLN
jgi:hypothetical protein